MFDFAAGFIGFLAPMEDVVDLVGVLPATGFIGDDFRCVALVVVFDVACVVVEALAVPPTVSRLLVVVVEPTTDEFVLGAGRAMNCFVVVVTVVVEVVVLAREPTTDDAVLVTELDVVCLVGLLAPALVAPGAVLRS